MCDYHPSVCECGWASPGVYVMIAPSVCVCDKNPSTGEEKIQEAEDKTDMWGGAR